MHPELMFRMADLRTAEVNRAAESARLVRPPRRTRPHRLSPRLRDRAPTAVFRPHPA